MTESACGHQLQSITMHRRAGHTATKIPSNHCFGCGKDNPHGMKLKFNYDERGGKFRARIRLNKRFAGPPGHAHGGIIATILDEAMSKLNKPNGITAVTSEMTVSYLRPVPLNRPLQVESHETSVDGRRRLRSAEISDASGNTLARGTGVFITVDPEKVFVKRSVR
jgi:uncharacterized protein (TIGR00369 family)